jgi:hypothetical protein
VEQQSIHGRYSETVNHRETLAFVMDLKNVRRGRIRDYTDQYKKAIFHAY